MGGAETEQVPRLLRAISPNPGFPVSLKVHLFSHLFINFTNIYGALAIKQGTRIAIKQTWSLPHATHRLVGNIGK